MPKKKYQKRKSPRSLPLVLGGIILLVVAFAFSLHVLSERATPTPETHAETMDHEQFIATLAPHAKELQQGYGVLPSIILGQAILESNWGQSSLASQYNNLFGVKAYGDAPKVSLETQEYVNEAWITINGDFRVYKSWNESMDDHTQLFVNGTNWNPGLYEKVVTAPNYKVAAQALQTAGYATDPGYAEKIINVIETYHLDQYDH
ncbi:glycoside hydrolase family 73 protein [Enterococcus sp. CSURQ0835]|uniref:glycoside hydrolase family 73 protein n=1 Tax=Enterococcus sp. CSURQ0835 TaxID=2681394 RepID=UPI001358A5D4|nr:glycoside hydrolase family 73 protein [Enterococcus sp. CSURQ0835]